MKKLTKSQEILLEYFKTPFDEEDAQKIINSDNAIKSSTEVTIIWSLFKAAEMLDDYYEGASETLSQIIQGTIEPADSDNEVTEVEDAELL